MSALLQKDFYVLTRQMKFYALLVVVYACVPKFFLNVFAVVYAATIPYTAIAFDEQSHWDALAAMMPYRTRDIVLSKYILGWCAGAISAAACLLGQTVICAGFLHKPSDFTPAAAVAVLAVAWIVMAISMPLLFGFPVEKARLLMFAITFFSAFAGGAAAGFLEDTAFLRALRPYLAAAGDMGPWLLLLAAAALTVSSVPLSVRLYEKNRRR